MSTATRTPTVRRSPWIRFAQSAAYSLTLPILLLAAWALWATRGASPFFPAPQVIFDAFVDTWVGPAFVTDVLPSLARLGIGLIGSIAIGIAAGTLIGTMAWLRELLEPLLEFFRAIPPPAMIPVIALILGPTDTMKIAVIVLGAVWPVLLNTIDGVRATDGVMKDTARSFQLTRVERVLIRLDGLDLIEPYHLRDLDDAISIVDIDAVGGVDLNTGGFDARYGNRLSGVFDMRSASVAPGPARTTLGLSLTSMRAASRGSFAQDRGRWLVSARRGYIDLALDLGGSDDEFSPTFYDVFGKVQYAFGTRAILSGHLLYARDLFEQVDEEGGDPDVDSEYGSAYGWLVLDASVSDRITSRSIAAIGGLRTDRLGSRERDRFQGALDVVDHQSYDFRSFRQEWSWQTSESMLTRLGFDLRSHDAEYDYSSTAETYYVDNGARQIAADTIEATVRPHGSVTSTWISQRFRPWAPFTFEMGLRWDRQSHTGESHASPRLGAALEIGPRTTARAAWGKYTQAHALHDLEIEDGFTTFSRAERGEHRILGVEHRLANEMRIRVEAYDIQLSRLRPHTVSIDGTLEFFPELTTTRRRIDASDGYSRGIEIMLNRRTMAGLDWAVSYALSESEARVEADWRARPHDQRHTFGFDIAWRPPSSWRFAAAWKYHSGWPNTPATLVADTAGPDIFFTRHYGEYNTGRLSSYHRLDLRFSRHVTTRRGRLLLFLDLFNAYGRDNPRAEYPYPIFLDGRVLTGSTVDTLLPRLPSFGVTWEF